MTPFALPFASLNNNLQCLRKVQRFSQFSWLRRWCLKIGLDKTIPFEAEELCLLSNILGIEARDLGVPVSGYENNQIEQGLLQAAPSLTVASRSQLQHRIREELSHRRQAFGVVIAVVAALSAAYSAMSASRSSATAQAAVNVILRNP